MIDLHRVTITHAGSDRPALRGIDLHVEEAELCVVVGATGVGKSTLLGAISGLVPHFTGGLLQGRVVVAGRDTRDHPPRELADVVGTVGQDPLAGFATDIVTDEIAFGMEQLGVDAAAMRKRVEEMLDLLGLADLRDRPLRTLSGGQQQRVAIGAVLAAGPRVLVLDEPTSALDPTAAEEVLAAVTRLVHDLGVTAVVAEHRLERILQHADTLVEVRTDGTIRSGEPGRIAADAAVAPPVVHLGRALGWSPVPLSVRDARRRATSLRDSLGASPTDSAPEVTVTETDTATTPRRWLRSGRRASAASGPPPALLAHGLVVRHGDVLAVDGVDLAVPPGQVVGLMGRNGSGKSSLLWALQGSGTRDGGTVTVDQRDPAELSPAAARRLVALVPQTPSDLLYAATVGEELAIADQHGEVAPGTCRDLLDQLVGDVPDERHPRDLSEGQRLALVLAVQLAAAPSVLLLDEPTRGLDYAAKDRLTGVLARLAADGLAVVVATHDVEFAAGTCDRVVVMSQAHVIADGPAATVIGASPMFAPQVAKVMHPHRWLTVDQVMAALQDRAGAST